VYRHWQEHIPAALMKAKDAAELLQANSLMGKIAQLEQEARRLGKRAGDAGDLRAAMGAIRHLCVLWSYWPRSRENSRDPVEPQSVSFMSTRRAYDRDNFDRGQDPGRRAWASWQMPTSKIRT